MKTLLFIAVLTYNFTFLAIGYTTEIYFSFEEDKYKDKEISRLKDAANNQIIEINKLVSPFLIEPAELTIIFSPDTRPFAHGGETKINTDSINDHLFTHEYGHVIFDLYLKDYSKYFYNKHFNDKDLTLAWAIRLASKDNENVTYADVIDAFELENFWNGTPYEDNSTDQEKELLIDSAKIELERYTCDIPIPNQLMMNKAPFHELFADVLTVLLAEDGEHVHKALIQYYKEKGITDPKDKRIIGIKKRNFVLPHENIDGMIKPHYMTGPVRNLIWKLAQTTYADKFSDLLFVVAKGVTAAYDEMAPRRDKTFGAKLLNEYLIRHIELEADKFLLQ